MRALRYLPPLAWTALIAWFSTGAWAAEMTRLRAHRILGALLPWASPETLEAIHWLGRKAFHAAEYGVLAGLWAGALPGWRAPLGLAVLTAFLDELHQATTLAREGSAADLLLDSAGAGVTLTLLRAGMRPVVARLTGALLWVGAAGGTAVLAVNVLAGAPWGWLSLSAPTAWLALILWRRRQRRPRAGPGAP